MPFSSAGTSTVGSNEEQDSMDKTMWQLSFPMNEGDSKRLSKHGATALKKEALKRCGLWHDPVPKLLSDTPEDLISGYPVYDRDIVDSEMLRGGQSQNMSSRVTLLGDAAHCMSPFKVGIWRDDIQNIFCIFYHLLVNLKGSGCEPSTSRCSFVI